MRLPEIAVRDRSVLFNEIGDILVVTEDQAGALVQYRVLPETHEVLLASDPSNTDWRREVAVNLWRLAGLPDGCVSWLRVTAGLEKNRRGRWGLGAGGS